MYFEFVILLWDVMELTHGEIRNSKCAILEHFSLHCYGHFTPKSENTEVLSISKFKLLMYTGLQCACNSGIAEVSVFCTEG